jgi:ABC-2 type transport system permease protein
MTRATTVERQKLQRSPVVWVATGLMVGLLPLMALGFYGVGVNGGTGPLAAKAEAFLVEEGWKGYLGLVDQITAVAMFLGAGVVVAWAFGREHSDRTFAALFALPVSRRDIALAKFIVLTGWITLLAALVTVVAPALGIIARIAPLDAGILVPGLARLFAVALATSLIALPVGYVASVGRGYLPAVGAIILLVAAAQIAVLFGTGQWFPFAVPGLMAVAGAEGAPSLDPVQIALVPATIAVAVWLTLRWWQRAEVA